MKFKLNNLSNKLVFSNGLILLVTLATTSFWLLHEVQELIERALRAAASHPDYLNQVEPFNWEIVAALFVPALVAFVCSLLVSSFSISHIVAPLKKLTQDLKKQNVTHLKLFECHQTNQEVEAITQALNELIEKMQMAFNRERQFTADVSHELRTPIAGIRLNLELLAQDHPEDINPLIARLDEMQHTIEQLLTMARLEQNMVIGLNQEIDLVSDVLKLAEREFKEILWPAHQSLVLKLPDSARIQGDKTLLMLLIRNLLENSSRYADKNSDIDIALIPVGEGWKLTVSDHGTGVDEGKIEALTNAYQRFDMRGNGLGLGLNIVARICVIHHAKLEIKNRQDPSGLQVSITFPV